MLDIDTMSPADLTQLTERLEMFDLGDEDARDLVAADFYRETGIDLQASRAPHLHEELAA